jgi:UDP-N-acetylglucosamine 2-epimerase
MKEMRLISKLSILHLCTVEKYVTQLQQLEYHRKKNHVAWWHTPVILATQEAKAGGSRVQCQSMQS